MNGTEPDVVRQFVSSHEQMQKEINRLISIHYNISVVLREVEIVTNNHEADMVLI